jgi:hypothetical protein
VHEPSTNSDQEDLSGFVIATAGLLNFRVWYDKTDSTLYMDGGVGKKIYRFRMMEGSWRKMRDEDWLNLLKKIKTEIMQ